MSDARRTTDMHVEAGRGGLPYVALSAADGARAEVYLHGAHVTSWRPAGGEERLFLSDRAEFGEGTAIRGGIPVIFPQFAGRGPLPKHGFARRRSWRLVRLERDERGASATFRLADDEATRAIWAHRFAADLTVGVGASHLDVRLAVVNADESSFSFTAALHTYLRVAEAPDAEVHGLRGATYDDPTNGRRVVSEDVLRIGDAIDRVYHGAQTRLRVHDGAHVTTILSHGFPDAVIWNPGEAASRTIGDMAPEEWRRMLCVEAAVVGEPVRLAPGERWSGTQRLEAMR